MKACLQTTSRVLLQRKPLMYFKIWLHPDGSIVKIIRHEGKFLPQCNRKTAVTSNQHIELNHTQPSVDPYAQPVFFEGR